VAGAGGWYWLTRTTAPPRREAQPPAPPAAASPQPPAPAAEREARAPAASAPAASPATPPPPAARETVPYVFQRQPVFYRTTHPVGTIVVSRSQRFLYWVRPNQVAIRYGIGIGPECVGTAGLFRIHTKVERPPPTAERLLYFGENLKLQGTDDLATVGRSTLVGCFQLANSDTFELYDRVPLQEAIVVLE
jgi:lipoprotein-anchoring transpeptidase ErfK/SrfK